MILESKKLIVRLLLAIIMGGFIGSEREAVDRPAGFRTHILVCLGSTVVMLVSIYMVDVFYGKINIDPTRIPAQVISGIGFLGAGTIIIEGVTVKGLTTAASLWTTAAIGLAIGSGFYKAAILATTLTYVTLITLAKFEDYAIKRRLTLPIFLTVADKPGQIGKIGSALGKLDVNIRNIEIEHIKEGELLIKIMLKKISSEKLTEVIKTLGQLECTYKIASKYNNGTNEEM